MDTGFKSIQSATDMWGLMEGGALAPYPRQQPPSKTKSMGHSAFCGMRNLFKTRGGGGGDPPFFYVAQAPRFQIEDIERIFRALNPSGAPDPFGRIEDLIISAGEEHVKNGVITDKFRKTIQEELKDIKSRTFGILFLQIFKALKLLFGLLPQGRIILIVLAALALLTATLEGETISLSAVREAVAKTGLAQFIDDIMEELTKFTTEIADDVEELAFASSDIFATVAIQIDAQINVLSDLVDDLSTFAIDDFDQALNRMDQVAFELDRAVNHLIFPANAVSNADVLLGPALRALDDQIRTIPTLALKLVRFN